MRAFVFSAIALLSTAAALPARADTVVRDHRDAVVRVRVAPPVVRTERRVVAPSSRHVWVPGYWGWREGRHVWIGGGWRLPPVQGQVWVEPRWVNDGGEWVFYAGYWGDAPGYQPAPEPVYAPPPDIREERWDVDVAPPPPRREERPPPPEPRGHVWIRGYWAWNGHEHAWVPGHWEAARPGWVWEPGHWERHHHHRWVWEPGHWERRP